MSTVELYTEVFDIISTGSVIIPANDYVEFLIEDLRFRFNMVQNDAEAQNGTIETNIEQDDKGQCLIITLINFSSSFFATPNEALRLAKVNNRDLFLQFSLMSINRSKQGPDGLLFYTWMLSKKDSIFTQNSDENGTK